MIKNLTGPKQYKEFTNRHREWSFMVKHQRRDIWPGDRVFYSEETVGQTHFKYYFTAYMNPSRIC